MSNAKTVRKTVTRATKPGSAAPAPRAQRTSLVAKKASAPIAEPAAAPTTAVAKAKHKLVRDSFTIPKSEYAVLEGLKARAAKLMRPVKKGELLRAGINALHKMTDKAFLAAMNDVPSLKTGRPKASELSAVTATTRK